MIASVLRCFLQVTFILASKVMNSRVAQCVTSDAWDTKFEGILQLLLMEDEGVQVVCVDITTHLGSTKVFQQSLMTHSHYDTLLRK